MADSRIIDLFPFHAEDILIVDVDCAAEILEIVEKGSYQIRFDKDYKARMKLLLEHKEKAFLVKGNWFEHLKHYDSALYSMHLANIGNMRILYVMGHRIIFLCAFEEKGEHGKKRQSYVQYVPIAIKRLERYKEE